MGKRMVHHSEAPIEWNGVSLEPDIVYDVPGPLIGEMKGLGLDRAEFADEAVALPEVTE